MVTAVRALAKRLKDADPSEWKQLVKQYEQRQKQEMIQFAKDALIKNDFGTAGLELQFRQQYP